MPQGGGWCLGEHQASCYQILALDGGGARAVFTAAFLAALEETSGIRLADCFDLVAGTSAGGLIALALGAGYKPSEILAFFKDRAPEIFPLTSGLARALRIPRWIARSKYESETLKGCLQEYFGDRRLGQSALRLVIPAFDSARGGVYLFKTPHHRDLRTDFQVPMWEVAYATAAAPTYFPAYVSSSSVRLVDGGIWANNPAMVALAEGLGYLGWPQTSISLLSIAPPHSPIGNSARSVAGGLFAWRDVVKLLMVGQSCAASNECLHILGEGRFYRVDVAIPAEPPLDQISDDLEGIGTTEARNLINRIDQRFLRHKAGPYKPWYQVNGNSPAEAKKGSENEREG